MLKNTDMQLELFEIRTDYNASYVQMQQEKEGPLTKAWKRIKGPGKLFYPLLLFSIIGGIFLGITLVGSVVSYLTLYSIPYVLAGGATLGGVGIIYGGGSAAVYYYGYSRKDPKDPKKGSFYKWFRRNTEPIFGKY